MNKKSLIYIPALAASITLSQLWVLAVSATSPISEAISAPISSPISSPITPTPEPTQAPSQPGNGGSNSGGGNSGGGSVPSCNDQKPASAPKLISAVSKKPNQVTLTWIKADDPVTYYLISYGTNQVANQFGNPNVGGSQTTSYTVNGLSGNVLYFLRVRAGNGCRPGDFSNVLSVRANGRSIGRPAIGFQPGVLGSKTIHKVQPKTSIQPIPTNQPAPVVVVPNNNVIQRVFTFFSNIFGR